jgi:hypothetical protein
VKILLRNSEVIAAPKTFFRRNLRPFCPCSNRNLRLTLLLKITHDCPRQTPTQNQRRHELILPLPEGTTMREAHVSSRETMVVGLGSHWAGVREVVPFIYLSPF